MLRRLFPAFLATILASGCTLRDPEVWGDQLAPAGPCWQVNLLDGLDEDQADELHALFACLNQGQNLAPLAELDGAMDTPSRTGRVLAGELGLLVNTAPSLGVDVFGLAGAAVDLLRQEDRPIEPLLELAVELLYGRPYAQVLEIDLQSGGELDRGIIRPLVPLMPALAGNLVDDGGPALGLAADVLTSPRTADAMCTLVGTARTADPSLQGVAAELLPDLGRGILVARSPENDRWSGASGDSLRDLLDVLLTQTAGDGQTMIEALGAEAQPLLDNLDLRDRVAAGIERAENGGHVDPLPLQLRYLVQVDPGGGSLDPDDDSALTALLRLLGTANQEVDCSLDLWVTDLEISLPNLSVELLRVMAQLDPDDAATGVDIMGDVLGWPLSELILDEVAASGVCPVIDEQLVADLESIDRFNDPEVGDLLVVLLELLGAVYDEGQDDRIPELVNVLHVAHARGLAPPLEEAVRDLADTALVDKLTDLVPLILDPSPLNVDACPADAQPLDWDALWILADIVLTGDGGARPLGTLAPIIDVLMVREETWLAAGNAATLMVEPDGQMAQIPELLAQLIEVDPSLEILHNLAPLLADPALHGPALRIFEQRTVADALGRAELSQEGPLPFAARLITGGTLAALLRTIDLLLGEFDRWADGSTDTGAP